MTFIKPVFCELTANKPAPMIKLIAREVNMDELSDPLSIVLRRRYFLCCNWTLDNNLTKFSYVWMDQR